MNTALWALQVVLAVKFASVAYTHGLRTDQAKMQQGVQKLGAAARPLLALISLCMFLGGVALILPFVAGGLAWLVPGAAGFLALLMLVGIGFHVAYREKPLVAADLVIFALAALVAYGRWVVVPL